MIQDARVLEEEFIPREVVHRHEEMNQLATALEPVIDGEQPEQTFLFGPTGAGKTCLARYSIQQLRQELLEFDWQYINCWKDYTKFRVLYRLLENVGNTFDISRQSTPRDELVARLRDHDGQVIVILDEVDQLREKDLLYDLHSMSEFTMVMIANREEELFKDLDDRIVSRLRSSRRIRFESYTVSELVDILSDRVEWGLEYGAIEQDQIERIARNADGDARVAIGILRTAATKARKRGLDSIDGDLVAESIENAQEDLRAQTIEKITDDQQLLYEIISSAETVSPTDLYERYEEAADDPMSRRTIRNYLTKLEHYNLIEAIGEGPSRKYRSLSQNQ